jgi:inhibitor of cysteine peptidase
MVDITQRHCVTRRQWLAGVLGAAAAMTSLAPARGQETRQTVRLSVPGSAVIALPETAGTGFGWRVNAEASSNLAVVAIADEGMAVPSSSPPIGATGERQYRITALRPGTAIAVFDYLRPWEHVAPARRRTVTIEISGR